MLSEAGKADNFSNICSIGYETFERPSWSGKYWLPEAREKLWDKYLNKAPNGDGRLKYPYYNPCDLLSKRSFHTNNALEKLEKESKKKEIGQHIIYLFLTYYQDHRIALRPMRHHETCDARDLLLTRQVGMT
jgi:hypothetical protein